MLKRLLTYLFITCALLSVALPIRADEREEAEYKVKAAFIYNFAKFVEWPLIAFAGPDDPIVFGVLGDDPLIPAFDALRGKKARGRTVVVRHFSSVDEVKVCHILLVGRSEQSRTEEIIVAFRGAPILLVGDMERFARQGGMIGFVLDRNKVSFEINAEACKKARLTVNSQLLKLANRVY